MKIRTFAALEIPGYALDELLNFKKNTIGEVKNAKWEPLEKLHITLKFLGDTEEFLIEEIINCIADCLINKNRFELGFERFGCFYKGKEPRILWAGFKENTELSILAEEIDNNLSKFGYQKEERKFKPHITLLRFKGFEDIKKILTLTNIKLPKIEFVADTVVLFKSTLKPDGSEYELIKKFELK